MTRFLRRHLPQTIVGQITSLVVVAVLLGVGLTTIVFVFYFEGESRANPELIAAAQAARIATIVRQAKADPSSPRLEQMISAVRWFGMHVETVQTTELAPAPKDRPAPSALLQSISTILKDAWGITTLREVDDPGADGALILKASNNVAVVVQGISPKMVAEFTAVPIVYAIAIITLILLFFSVYGVRWITSPLSSAALAVRAFGRAPMDDGTLTDWALSEKGPREIVELAAVLNDTARRIRTLMNERTRMLAAISHDLRTPLTRMRLRAERIDDVKTRDSMLNDIATISDMLNATLVFLRDGGRSEPVHLVDLSSLLQTICGQFNDVGHSVAYEGPGRFAFACRATALTRAVTNIVENGVKNGSSVVVVLKVLGDGAAQIEVSDDGPGIPVALQDKVFDTFFKGDSARPSSRRGGFGLGLSIARHVARNHGGEIFLANRQPHGLTVRMELKPDRAEASAPTSAPAGGETPK